MIQPDIPTLNIVEKEKGNSNPGSKERKEERTEIISRNTSTKSNHHEPTSTKTLLNLLAKIFVWKLMIEMSQ